MIDPTRRFLDRVDAYARHRPGYPEKIIDLLKLKCGLEPLRRVDFKSDLYPLHIAAKKTKPVFRKTISRPCFLSDSAKQLLTGKKRSLKFLHI